MFEEISMYNLDNINQNIEDKKLALAELQKQAAEELEATLSGCDSIDAVIIEVSAWQDKYNIIDIDDFFGDNTELASKVHQLIASKLEELRIKEEKEKALTEALAMISQKKTFYRLYSILSEAKNDKDFERANEKLKSWLKDHPEKSWEQFTEQYQSYFKKVANIEYLEYITGKATQDKIVSTLEEIYDHATRYSDYAFFHENTQKFQSDYSTRDQFLSAEQKERIEALIKDGYERLMPPEITENQIAEFDSQNGAFVYQSLASSLSSSSSKETTLMDWLALNGSTLTDLGSNDKAKISELLMQKFKINIIPDKFDYSAKSIEDDTSVKNVQANTINYVLYKLNSSDGITIEDIGIFQAASVKSDLSEIATGLEPIIDNSNIDYKDETNKANKGTTDEQHEEANAEPSTEEQTTLKQGEQTIEEQTVVEKPEQLVEEPTTEKLMAEEQPTLESTSGAIITTVLASSTQEDTSIEIPVEFAEQELIESDTTTEEPVMEVKSISELDDTDNEPIQILAEEPEPEEDSTLKTEATIEAEPIIEETDLGEPVQSISQEEILVEPVLEADAEEPIQSASQEERAVNNTITPEHETINDPEKNHTVEKENIADTTYQFETTWVPERMGDEPINTQTNFDEGEKEPVDREEQLPEKEKNEVNTKSRPISRVVAWFSKKTDGGNVVSIKANDTEPTPNKDNDFERKRFF